LRAARSLTYDSGVLPSRGVSLILAGALGMVPLLPAEHAHEVEADGHSRVVVHQHAQPHSIGHLPGAHHRRGRQQIVDHPDEPVLTLSTVFTNSTPHTLAIPLRVVVAIIQPVQLDLGRASTGFVERLIHGPPRAPSGLRAPPAFLA